MALPKQPAGGRSSRCSFRALAATAIGVLAISLLVLPAAADDERPPDTASAPGVVSGQYIVTLKSGFSPDAVAGESEGRGDRIDHVYRSAGRGFSGRLSDAEVARLRVDPRVERVEADQVVHAVVDQTQSPAPSWGLDRIDERAPDATSSYTYSTTASDVTAYVIDTGIYPANVDFTGRIDTVSARNFVAVGGTTDPANWADCNGHGTHVAGTIGGTTYGIAKGITLVPVRVLDCTGSGTWSGVIAGLDYVTAQHTTGKAVANLSLGGGFSQSVNDAVARAVSDGVVVAVAAGNGNADACASSPASEPSALTVGATDSGDTRASFSNYGSCVDLFAPGVSITSDWLGSATATNTISGTSMASPHVAGVAALYLASGRTTADLMANVTTGRVVNAGNGSANKLIYVGTAACTPTSCPSAPPPPPPPGAPANDAFTNAQTIATTTGSVTGTTVNATKETGEPNHAGNGGGHSIWYQFTATGTGTATIDTFASSYDTLLAAYTGSTVNALTQTAANDDTAPGNQSRVQFSVVAGTTYRIAVDGYAGASGTVTLNWTLPSTSQPPPPPPPPPPTGNTGWKDPNAQAADSGGDGNGYETTPTNAYADDGVYAVDNNSGTNTSTSCTSTGKDKHRFSGYGLTLPANATVKGLEVRVQAKADSTSNTPRLCVQLSWDGGTSWTTAKTTANLTTTETTLTVGSTSDLWGRAWTSAEIGSNFRVRVIDVSSSTSRDFWLDAVAVRVTY